MAFKVFICDDHDIIRQGLKTIIEADSNYELCGEAVSTADLMNKIGSACPDILVLDITLSDGSSLDFIREIKTAMPAIKVLIVSVHKAPAYILKATSLGVAGYLIKDTAAEELLPALARISRGQSYFGGDSAACLAEPKIDLTRREREILRLTAEGKTAREIADVLCVSPRTVENNRNALMKKFGVHRTVDLVKHAVNYRLVD